MDEKGTYINLFRKFITWEWYQNSVIKDLFIHCLLKANWQDKSWQGQVVKRGSFVTSTSKLSEELGFTIQQTRTALDKLKSTCDITCKATNKNTIITVVKYDDYQTSIDVDNKQSNTQPNNQTTNEQQTNNKQITTTNKDKNKKKEKKDKKEVSKKETYDHIISRYFNNKNLIIVIHEFIKMRVLIKKPMTNYALEGMLKKLTKIASSDEDRIEILNNSIEKNWLGIFELKKNQELFVVEDTQEVIEVQTVDNTELQGLLETLKKGEL